SIFFKVAFDSAAGFASPVGLGSWVQPASNASQQPRAKANPARMARIRASIFLVRIILLQLFVLSLALSRTDLTCYPPCFFCCSEGATFSKLKTWKALGTALH